MIIERKCIERGADEIWDRVEEKYFINVMENRGRDPNWEIKRMLAGFVVRTQSFEYRGRYEL